MPSLCMFATNLTDVSWFFTLSFYLFVGKKLIHLKGSLKEAGEARGTRGTQTEIRNGSNNEHNTDNNKRRNRTKA